MTNNNSNNELQQRAKELVENHGKSAVEVARRKANSFQKDCREKDFALMLLTEVEKLTRKSLTDFSKECKAPQVIRKYCGKS